MKLNVLIDFMFSDGSYNGLSWEERYELIRSVGEECVAEEELKNMLQKMPRKPRCYDGFEPSGRMHIAQVGNILWERIVCFNGNLTKNCSV